MAIVGVFHGAHDIVIVAAEATNALSRTRRGREKLARMNAREHFFNVPGGIGDRNVDNYPLEIVHLGKDGSFVLLTAPTG